MTEQALVKREEAPVPINWNDVRKYYADDFSDKEWAIACGKCKSLGLDPQKGECHFVKYGTRPGQVVTDYKEYLKRAEGTGMLNGWKVSLDNGQKHTAAVITIWRKDWEEPLVWEVDREEFDKGQSTWKSMPKFMLKKVAIAQGMRLAFPEEVGNLPYLPEEVINFEAPAKAAREVAEKPTPAPAKEKPFKKPLLDFDGLIKMQELPPKLVETFVTKGAEARGVSVEEYKDLFRAAPKTYIEKFKTWVETEKKAETQKPPKVVEEGKTDAKG